MSTYDYNTVHLQEGQQYAAYAGSYPPYVLGTLGLMADGKAFKYVKNGGVAGAAGKLCQSPAPVTAHVNLAVAATAVGATTIAITFATTSITADQYKDGFVAVEDVAGQGFMYRIASHGAVASSVGLFTAPLVGTVQKALTASSKVSLLRNPCDSVIIHPSPPTAPLAGVWTTDIAASSYGWVQILGYASVLQDGVVVAGNPVVPSVSVDGAVSPITTTQAVTDQTIGRALRNTGDTKYASVDLFIA